jgi:hypothetical protein
VLVFVFVFGDAEVPLESIEPNDASALVFASDFASAFGNTEVPSESFEPNDVSGVSSEATSLPSVLGSIEGGGNESCAIKIPDTNSTTNIFTYVSRQVRCFLVVL